MAEALVSTPSRKWVDLHPGDRLVAGSVEVQMVHKTGRVARVCVLAPADLSVDLVKPIGDACHSPDCVKHDKVGSARSG